MTHHPTSFKTFHFFLLYSLLLFFMFFKYKALTPGGDTKEGTLEAKSKEEAVAIVGQSGLRLSQIEPIEKKSALKMEITIFERVTDKEIVLMSRQISTLFESSVSSLRVFRLLSEITKNPLLSRTLTQIADDIQEGKSISTALSKHPKVFSDFYVNMVRSGEESGTLNYIFNNLAEYIDRTYGVTSKIKNALIYPIFVILVFVSVMVLMLTMVIPQLAAIIKGSGLEPPIYTKIVIGTSDFLVQYGFFLLILLIIGAVAIWQYGERLGISWDRIKISLPYIGELYRKFYISRIADNLNTMISGGIPAVRVLKITSENVDNDIYREIMDDVAEKVRDGLSISESMAGYDEIPNIMVQMTKVGEETGELGNILDTLSTFYRREVNSSVDTLISLIEPAMIVGLGVAVGVLLASVLVPIYNMSAAV